MGEDDLHRGLRWGQRSSLLLSCLRFVLLHLLFLFLVLFSLLFLVFIGVRIACLHWPASATAATAYARNFLALVHVILHEFMEKEEEFGVHSNLDVIFKG